MLSGLESRRRGLIQRGDGLLHGLKRKRTGDADDSGRDRQAGGIEVINRGERPGLDIDDGRAVVHFGGGRRA